MLKTKSRTKPKRKRKNGMRDAEKVIRGVQAIALVGTTIYKIVKPHLKKIKPKKLPKGKP